MVVAARLVVLVPICLSVLVTALARIDGASRSDGAAAQPPVRWSLAPDLIIESHDSLALAQLSRVLDVLAAPDGFIFVADNSGGPLIRVYDPRGRLISGFGKLGDGPEEFSPAVDLVGTNGDTVFVYDQNRGRVQVMLRNGTFVRSRPIPGAPASLQVRGYLAPRHALVETDYWTGRKLDSVAFIVADSMGRALTRVAVDRTPPEMLSVPSIRFVVMKQPFAPAIATAHDPTGTTALVAVPSAFFGGRPGQVRLVVVDRRGIQSDRTIDLGARRMTDALRDTWIREQMDRRADQIKSTGVPRQAAERDIRDQLVVGQYLPELEEVRLGSDGVIWLKPHGDIDWLVVTPAGAVSARVQVPADLRIHQVSSQWLWGSARDSEGLPVVRRFRVVPR